MNYYVLCGNFPVEIVRGNCDFETNNKLYLTIELECHKIFATHGHAYGVEWGIERLSYAALEEGCDIAMVWTYTCSGNYSGR